MNTIVLVGLMGAGKTRIGQELARLLKCPFCDSDKEIERAAGLEIAEIFERLGEVEFRKGEKKVILRLLSEHAGVMATGGGAFMQPDIRSAIKNNSISVWLRASIDTLVERASRTDHRPLLRGVDKKEKLQELIDIRYPVYAEADIVIDTDGRSAGETAKMIKAALDAYRKEGRA